MMADEPRPAGNGVCLPVPMHLQCIEFREVLSGGRTEPRTALAAANDGHEFHVVVKLRKPVTQIGHGHYGGTSLACELICAVLARMLGLPVPDYAIVHVPQGLAEAQPNAVLRDLLQRNVGPNFATVYQEGYMLWSPSDRAHGEDLLDAFEDTLAFDAAVVNGDRNRQKPNLLVRGQHCLLIDHSLALPSHLWSQEQIDSSPLLPDGHIRDHAVFRSLSSDGRTYERLLERWSPQPEELCGELRAMIPPSWENRLGDLDRIFSFLSGREAKFPDISGKLCRVVR